LVAGAARRLSLHRRLREALGAPLDERRRGVVRIPPAYDLVRAGPVRAALRRDLRPLLEPWLLAPRLVLPAGAEPLAGGRGGAFRAVLPGGQRVIVRLYRRGGVL